MTAADDWWFTNDGEIVKIAKVDEKLGEIPREIEGDPITEDDLEDFGKLLGL